ncbi:MAG TPA: NAD(P)H-binding protein, partial [Blastocatellia bacterium]|nr:NAD(P)H-binding protein [Blastocatellia bacterium]
SRVVECLLQRGDRPRVFVREEKRARSRFGDRVDVFVGDLADPASLKTALDGVEVLFLVNTGPQIPVQDEGAAKVAKAAGVKHLVKLSSMDVQQGLAIGAWHERGEAAIRASGIPFTFVQPTGFMSNLLAWAPSIKAEGVVRSSTGDGRRAFIHSDDIAAVATKVLTTREHGGESLPITGPEALSFAEATAKLSVVIGRGLTFQPISDEEARQRYAASGASPPETDAHVSLWRAIREGRLANITDNVERLLGRKPITMDQWARENAAAFR